MEQNQRAPEPEVSEDELLIPGQEQTEASSNGIAVILGLLIVALALILGGLYLWGSLLAEPPAEPTPVTTRPTAEENNEPESTTAEADVETAQALSTSDSLSAIAADLENTDIETLTNDLTAIEAEFDAAVIE